MQTEKVQTLSKKTEKIVKQHRTNYLSFRSDKFFKIEAILPTNHPCVMFEGIVHLKNVKYFSYCLVKPHLYSKACADIFSVQHNIGDIKKIFLHVKHSKITLKVVHMICALQQLCIGNGHLFIHLKSSFSKTLLLKFGISKFILKK